MCFSRHVPQERADGGGGGRNLERRAPEPRDQPARRDVPRRGAFDVPLDARDLARAVDMRARLERTVRGQRARSVEEGIPVDLPETDPLRVRKARDAAREDALLLRPREPGLEADQVVGRAGAVFTA